MNDTLQLVIIVVIVVAAGIGLWRALRRPDCGCDGCSNCPLSNNCNRKDCSAKNK